MHKLAFLTQHEKLPAVVNALSKVGFDVVQATGMDTDTLGTFTGEVARKTTQLQAALAKAKLATELTQSRFGLGSEGSFGPDPFVGVTAWGIEILALWDSLEQHAVHAVAQGPQTNYEQKTVSSWTEAKEFSASAGFPEHGVIVGKPGDSIFEKSIADWSDLEKVVSAGLNQGKVWLETDMRAHRNPTRMAMIEKAAEELAKTWAQKCPECSAPGFSPHSLISGALCNQCQRPTRSARAQVFRCDKCGFTLEQPIRTHVAPDKCEHCNP